MESEFGEGQDLGEKPSEVTVADQLHWAELEATFRRCGGRPMKDDPIRVTGMKQKSMLFRLPYWHALLVRHILDVMHI